jgi:hypothetical protein
MGEIFEGDSLNGKASIRNYKSPRSPSLEKDDWARCIQASIPLSEYDLDTSSVTSSSNWIKAFRTQSRGQEVTIPCVSSQFEEEDHDERVERMLPSFSTSTSMRGPTRVGVGASGTSSHQQRKIDSKVKQHQIYFQIFRKRILLLTLLHLLHRPPPRISFSLRMKFSPPHL